MRSYLVRYIAVSLLTALVFRFAIVNSGFILEHPTFPSYIPPHRSRDHPKLIDIKAGIRAQHQKNYRHPISAVKVSYHLRSRWSIILLSVSSARGDIRPLTTLYSGHSDLFHFRHVHKLVDSHTCLFGPMAPETGRSTSFTDSLP